MRADEEIGQHFVRLAARRLEAIRLTAGPCADLVNDDIAVLVDGKLHQTARQQQTVPQPKAGSLLRGEDECAVIDGLYEVGIVTYRT